MELRRDRARAECSRPPKAAGSPVEELSCDGQSAPCRAGRSDSATSCGSSPSTRIPLPSHAAAAACRQDTCPASHSARRSHTPPRNGTRLRIAPTSTHETSRHGLLPTARPTVRQARAVSRAPQRNGRRGVAPVRARPRRGAQCPCGASTALPRDCGEARPAPSGAATDARRFVRRRPKGASDCGRQYHAVITAALTACLADPLPHKARRPLLPPVTTPFRTPPSAGPSGLSGSDRRQSHIYANSASAPWDCTTSPFIPKGSRPSIPTDSSSSPTASAFYSNEPASKPVRMNSSLSRVGSTRPAVPLTTGAAQRPASTSCPR